MRRDIDTTKATTARMYDYFLGGKDHYEADRRTAEQAMRGWPTIRTGVRENRAFMGRAVRFLVAEAGIRQFLDIGTGLPSADNVHQVAQGIAPECRVVYVDNDPIVLAHARALLTSTPEGRTTYIEADLRDPRRILEDPATRQTLDFTQPIALMLVAILHFVPDEDDPARILSTLIDALPSGSYVVASHATAEFDPVGMGAVERAYREGGISGRLRDADEFAEIVFGGLEMVDPGVVVVSEWRPEHGVVRPLPAEVNWNGGIGRKR